MIASQRRLDITLSHTENLPTAMKFILILLLALQISACSSFGRGFGEGIGNSLLSNQNKQDTRICQVFGESFGGLQDDVANSGGKTHLLMIHGVGNHLPGYSYPFMEKLAHELDLPILDRNYKEIYLTRRQDTSKELGNLRVRRLRNEAGDRELLFYELTWSDITAAQKAKLGYDSSVEYAHRRADINNLLKQFANETGPDPMLYLGESHDDILASFRQSICWMIAADWDELPHQSREFCNPFTDKTLQRLRRESYAVVSHSLGSRITMDALQSFAEIFVSELTDIPNAEMLPNIISAFQNQQIPLYMLSNQLPILQMGRKPPQVSGEKDDYCFVDGKQYDNRILTRTSIIAFSDPNDLLSYAIPNGFAETSIDSRFCVDITNININIAEVVDFFGFGSVANPLTAHTGYDSDDRVVALIAKGIGTVNAAERVKERCEWIKLAD